MDTNEREVKTGEIPIDVRTFIDLTNLKEKSGSGHVISGVLVCLHVRGAALVRSFSLREWKVIKSARSHM